MNKMMLFSNTLMLAFVVACSEPPAVPKVASTNEGARSGGCNGYDGTAADPCKMSLHALIAQPAQYDGVYVEITGLYTVGLDQVLFVDRDSAENSILKNGVLVSLVRSDIEHKLDAHRNKFITFSGMFSSIKRNRSEFGGRDFSQFSGVVQVDKVGSATSAPIPYACWDPSRDRAYDPKTVKELLGEVVCKDPILNEPE
jgi:hypothetical protein